MRTRGSQWPNGTLLAREFFCRDGLPTGPWHFRAYASLQAIDGTPLTWSVCHPELGFEAWTSALASGVPLGHWDHG